MNKKSFLSGNDDLQKRKKRKKGYSQPNDNFTDDKVMSYVFKEAILHSSVLTSSKINFSVDELSYLKKHQMLFTILLEGDRGMDNLILADSLASLLRVQIYKSKTYIASIEDDSFDSFYTLPFPPYIPYSFLSDLKRSVEIFVHRSNDANGERIKRGLTAFLHILELLKTNVYPLLFKYLLSSDIKTQQGNRDNLRDSYYSFLMKVDEVSHDLLYFCAQLMFNNVLSLVRKRVLPLKTDTAKQKDSGGQKSSSVEPINSFFSSSVEDYISLFSGASTTLKDRVCFVPLVFSTPFPFLNTQLYAMPPSEFLLHLSPLLGSGSSKNVVYGWFGEYNLSKMNMLFLYKKQKSMAKKNPSSLLVEKIIMLDEKKSAFKERRILETITKTSTALEELKESSDIIQLITQNVKDFEEEVKKDISNRINILIKKDFFLRLSQIHQLIAFFNVARICFFSKRNLLKKINLNFYAKLRKDLLQQSMLDTIRDLSLTYAKLSDDNKITSSHTSVSGVNVENASINEGKEVATITEKEPIEIESEDDDNNNTEGEDEELTNELKGELFG